MGDEIVLTFWRLFCGILGLVELFFIVESSGRYLLYEESKKWLKRLGYVLFDENMDG